MREHRAIPKIPVRDFSSARDNETCGSFCVFSKNGASVVCHDDGAVNIVNFAP